MADITSSITVDRSLADEIRTALVARVRLKVTQRRHWLLWRVFTVTGPKAAVQDALRDAEDCISKNWWAAQW